MSLDLYYGQHKKDWRDRSRKDVNRPWWTGKDDTKNLHHAGVVRLYSYRIGRKIKESVTNEYQEYMDYLSRRMLCD